MAITGRGWLWGSAALAIVALVAVTGATIGTRVLGTPARVAACIEEKNARVLDEAKKSIPVGSSLAEVHRRLAGGSKLVDVGRCMEPKGFPELACPINTQCDPGLPASEIVFRFSDGGHLEQVDVITLRMNAK